MYVRDVLGCSVTLNDQREDVPRWAMPFVSGNMPFVLRPATAASSCRLPAAADATSKSSLKSVEVPPLCPTSYSARNVGAWRAAKTKPSIRSVSPLSAMQCNMSSDCSVFSSSSSRSSSSGDGGGDSSIPNEIGEEGDELEHETEVAAEEMKAAAFLLAAQNGEAGRGFLALGISS